MAKSVTKPVSELCFNDIGKRVAVVTTTGARIEDTLKLICVGAHLHDRGDRHKEELYLEFENIGTQDHEFGRGGRLGVYVHFSMKAVVRDVG